MNPADALKLCCNVSIDIIEDGVNVGSVMTHNRVVVLGRYQVLRFLNGSVGENAILNIGFGIGTGATLDTANALSAEVFRELITRRTLTESSLTFMHYITSSSYNGVAFAEAGLFHSDGTMFARVNFTPITKLSSQSLAFSWSISIASS